MNLSLSKVLPVFFKIRKANPILPPLAKRTNDRESNSQYLLSRGIVEKPTTFVEGRKNTVKNF